MTHKTDWFKEAKWGAFMHFLAAPASSPTQTQLNAAEWNKTIDNFDAKGLAQQLAEIKAGYFFLTIGQNTGYWLSPNKTYDDLVGRNPSHCSERDLMSDMIEALDEYNIPLMAYLPSHAPAMDRQAVEGLSCTPEWDASKWQLKPGLYLRNEEIDPKLSKFQRNWEAIISEWSIRWGDKVKGWWFDGCYHADIMYNDEEDPNFKTFADAARAGNPNSIVAFNTGVEVPITTASPYQDYTAGEVANEFPMLSDVGWEKPLDRFIDGAQYHLLTYLGSYWGRDDIRFPDELVIGYTKQVNSRDAVITWDIGKTDTGLIGPQSFKQLKALAQATR